MMKKSSLTWLSLFCALCLLALFALMRDEKITSFSGNTMTIDYRILIGKELSVSEQQLVEQVIDSTFQEVNSVYNKWNPNSELSALNHHPLNTPFTLSPKLEKLLLLTHDMFILTEGRFDPTIEGIQQRWKQKTPPTDEELQKLAVGWQHLQFSPREVIKLQDVKIDLGGIAKGFAVDLLLQALKNEGFSDIYVEWGGEIAASGQHPSGRPWTIYISRMNDAAPERAIAILPLNDTAIATSGDYLQQWKIGDDTYFHIIDPRTKKPLKTTEKSVASASVCAKSCVMADGLATAAMLFPTVEEARNWLDEITKSHPEISFWLISRG